MHPSSFSPFSQGHVLFGASGIAGALALFTEMAIRKQETRRQDAAVEEAEDEAAAAAAAAAAEVTGVTGAVAAGHGGGSGQDDDDDGHGRRERRERRERQERRKRKKEKEKRRERRWLHLLSAEGWALTLWLALGCAYGTFQEQWTLLDSLYFSVRLSIKHISPI